MIPNSHFAYCAITVYLIFLTMPFSNEGNINAEYYRESCNSSFSCGQIENLGYPFWRGDMPEQCGQRSEFKLSCGNHKDTDKPRISIGNNGLQVLNISTSSHTMLLYQDRNRSCRIIGKNESLTVEPPFKFGASVVNISLFYGCTNNLISKYGNNSIWCSSFGNNVSVYYLDKSGPDFNKTSKSCNNSITIPVLKTAVDGLQNGTETLESVLEKGFKVEYTVDFKNCSTCQNSSGICGSSGHPSWKFVCYCPDGCQSPLNCCSISDAKKRDIGRTLGLGICGITCIIALVTFWYWRKFKSGQSKFVSRSSSLEPTKSDLEKGSIHFGVPLFSYKELEQATNNFDQSKELGDGAFGRVYHGKLNDGREVAVKRLYERSFRTMEQFMNEVQILTRLRHNKLVSLYGCTSPRCTHLLLVYEYVSNGTVADHLYGHVSKSGKLSWPVRMKIAIETANALSYLHASDIIHRDVKTNNILLDSSFSVKVADFGLSRLFPDNVTHVSTAPQGTPGYLDPEYHQCYQLTVKSDVYSFGVVLIELVSSLPAVDINRHKNEINLSNYAMNMIQRCAFKELVDPQLGFGHDFKVRRMTTSVAELAFRCLQHDKDFRPSMDEVLENLKKIESADYEALEAENEGVVENSMPPPVLTEDDDAGLLSSHEMHHLSPNCVMDSWNSRSSISSNRNQGAKFSSM